MFLFLFLLERIVITGYRGGMEVREIIMFRRRGPMKFLLLLLAAARVTEVLAAVAEEQLP